MNNIDIYNAALAGVAGGIATSRANRSTNSSDYTSQASICQAFATEMDSLIPTIPHGPTDAMIDIMIQLCIAFWANRVPRSVVASSYLTECRQILAMWTAVVGVAA